MNPLSLVTPSLIETVRPLQNTIILGYTKTGKVTIAKEIAKQLDRPIIISDNFQYLGHDNALKMFSEVVYRYVQQNIPIIVEGILAFRFLREGTKFCTFNADIIIKTVCDPQTIEHFYSIEEPGKNINRVHGFNQGLDKIWNEYLQLLVSSQFNQPEIIYLNTSL